MNHSDDYQHAQNVFTFPSRKRFHGIEEYEGYPVAKRHTMIEPESDQMYYAVEPMASQWEQMYGSQLGQNYVEPTGPVEQQLLYEQMYTPESWQMYDSPQDPPSNAPIYDSPEIQHQSIVPAGQEDAPRSTTCLLPLAQDGPFQMYTPQWGYPESWQGYGSPQGSPQSGQIYGAQSQTCLLPVDPVHAPEQEPAPLLVPLVVFEPPIEHTIEHIVEPTQNETIQEVSSTLETVKPEVQNPHTPEDIKKKGIELMRPLYTPPTCISKLAITSNWFLKLYNFFTENSGKEDIKCVECNPCSFAVADEIERAVGIIQGATEDMLEYARKIREICEKPEFVELRKLQSERNMVVRCPAKIEKSEKKWSKKPTNKERIPMVKGVNNSDFQCNPIIEEFRQIGYDICEEVEIPLEDSWIFLLLTMILCLTCLFMHILIYRCKLGEKKDQASEIMKSANSTSSTSLLNKTISKSDGQIVTTPA